MHIKLECAGMETQTQMYGKRRAPRYYLGGVVELTDLATGQTKVALVRALSLYGCFVKTEMAVKEMGRVRLKIAHSGTQFAATGRVVNHASKQNNRGLGIEFTEIYPIDKNTLETCLAHLAAAHSVLAVPSP
jgi:hypothetical protein